MTANVARVLPIFGLLLLVLATLPRWETRKARRLGLLGILSLATSILLAQ